ncbi:MAG: CpaF family protein [Actinobacteria bacterium]|nr:CpaF family protein [Actinomycetota bacterium]
MAPILQRLEAAQRRPGGSFSILNTQRAVKERVYASISPGEILRSLELNPVQVRRELEGTIRRIIEEGEFLLPRLERDKVISGVLNEILGYGPIEPLLADPSISEIMVNGPYRVYIERSGRIAETDITFEDNEHVLRVIDKILAPIGRRVDESSPMVNARLPDGSRVNVVIPPLSLNGPTLTIRKFKSKLLGLQDLVELGSLTEEMAELFEASIKSRLNTVVTGGTGSGKTTLLNVLSSMIPSSERIVTVEDSAELRFNQPHVVSLEGRPPNIEGKGQVAIRDLVINALRMRPDRIVVGEVRGGEALDMLQAMNTGHDGSLTTLHANSPREAVSRLETMVMMAGTKLPIQAIREQIVGGVDLIIHQARFQDGSRKVTDVAEVVGLEGERVVLESICGFRPERVDEQGQVKGDWLKSGYRPHFLERLASYGVKVPSILLTED